MFRCVPGQVVEQLDLHNELAHLAGGGIGTSLVVHALQHIRQCLGGNAHLVDDALRGGNGGLLLLLGCGGLLGESQRAAQDCGQKEWCFHIMVTGLYFCILLPLQADVKPILRYVPIFSCTAV